ncbi:MAG: aldehyde dehydrogenase (NADP(+)) [Mycobacterium sp.]
MTSNLTKTVEAALAGADSARAATRKASAAERAAWLRAVADGLQANADTLVEIARRETRLDETRLRGELRRTVFQAQLFAQRLEEGKLFDVRSDAADPDWPMGPRPDIRRSHVPIGPVLVFSASNFPLAFSVAGGDSVSALAAGCPVVVKAHSGHLELSEKTAEIVIAELARAGAPAGVFGLISGQSEGAAAVQDRRIRAVGFTGSVSGGRALFDLAVSRPDPIPFYGELGSTNPVLVTYAGWEARADDIVSGFTTSFTASSGQFCTQPGVVLVPDLAAFLDRLEIPAVGPMLNDRIDTGFAESLRELGAKAAVEIALQGPAAEGAPRATILTATAEAAIADPSLVNTEMFGPATMVVHYRDAGEALAVLSSIPGSLTATIQGGDDVDTQAADALDVLSDRAGRVIWNQWPTGVTVSDAQQHGGPWPSTTASTTTSVGTAAAQRFVRPVAYQNMPTAGLPEELRA